jgi:hypothetical protein
MIRSLHPIALGVALILSAVADASLFGVRNVDSLRRLSTLRGGAAGKIDGPCIGIDLGTTYSCVAVWNKAGGRVDICPNDQGNRITPSYVAFLPDGTRLIGDSAKNQAPSNPSGTCT